MGSEFYLQKGISAKHFNVQDKDEFYVSKISCCLGLTYSYPNDSIIHEIDTEASKIYDLLRDMFFPDKEEYYRKMDCLPDYLHKAGHDSDCILTAQEFCRLLRDNVVIDMVWQNKSLYLSDVQNLIGSIQNHVIEMDALFKNYYIDISTFNPQRIAEDGEFFLVSTESRLLSAMVENYFIKAYAILDLLVKLIYNIIKPVTDFTRYKRLQSNNKLWGDKKELSLLNLQDTLFEDHEIVSIIESLRNEVVHNGTWELNPKVFYRVKDGKIVERFMRFPDISQGHLDCVNNRKHFFGQEKKINDTFSQIHYVFMSKLYKTLMYINSMTMK